MLITRAEATAQGLTRYYTGKPCRKGHVAERSVGNGGCARCSIATKRKWKKANPAAVNAQARAARRANPTKVASRLRAWKRANAAKVNAAQNARYAAKINAVPDWADHDAIREAYAEAAYHGLEVDHIVPLQSPLVSGLHVWDNLQLLTPLENKVKGNRVWPDMPGSA